MSWVTVGLDGRGWTEFGHGGGSMAAGWVEFGLRRGSMAGGWVEFTAGLDGRGLG